MNEPEIIYKAVQDGSIQVLSQLFYLDPKLINHRCEINNKTLVETAVRVHLLRAGGKNAVEELIAKHTKALSKTF